MHPAIKLRHIRAFLDIASEGSLSAVARLHGVTQPALSRSLAELETLLGQELFARQGRRLVLTDAGRMFRRHAAAGLQAFEDGARALQPGEGGGFLSIGVLPSAASGLLPPVALRFRTLMPMVTLCVETGPNIDLLRHLREGRIDLVVGRMPAAREMADLTFEHLYEEPVLLCARAGHPLRDRPAAEILRVCPLILPSRDAIIRRVVDDYLTSIGIVGISPAFETVSLAFGRGLLTQSDAVWFISRGVVAHELARGDLIAIETGARFLSGAIGMTGRRSGETPPGLDLLRQLTREAAMDQGEHAPI